MSSTYRTAQGKMVDINALRLKNESVRAVGNMNVNAKGDLIDSRNRTISTRNNQVENQYRKQVDRTGKPGNVNHNPPATSLADLEAEQKLSEKPTRKTKTSAAKVKDDAAKPVSEKPQVPETKVVDKPAGSSGGLSAAIARAREIRQEPIDNKDALAQKRPGIVKI
jgi:hypothetical protein